MVEEEEGPEDARWLLRLNGGGHVYDCMPELRETPAAKIFLYRYESSHWSLFG